jgi:ribosomal-protein-alanine N-acetyltransferase
MLKVPDEIATPRLTLRRIRRGDAPAIFHAYSSYPESARYMTFPVAQSVADTEPFVDWAVAAWESGRSYQFAITLAGGRIIGGCGFEQAVPGIDRHFSCGYCLAPQEWNRGYATEVACAIRTWFESADGVYRLSALVDVDNPASFRVLEKAGFAFEGILRRYALHPNISNEPRDVRVYAVAR